MNKLRAIEPHEFFAAFVMAATEFKEDLIKYWRSGLTQYTQTIRSILPKVASSLNLNLYNADYYTLDAVFYKEKDTEHFPPKQTFLKSICIAFEHENAVAGSVNEMNKLQLFNAPLKVLVTYGGQESCKDYLAKYAKIVANADIFLDISTHRKQLVIFGEESSGKVMWYPFTYKDGSFEPVQ